MAQTLAQVNLQIALLQKKADALKNKEKVGVIGRIKEAIAIYGLTAAELGLAPAGGKAIRKAPAKKKGLTVADPGLEPAGGKTPTKTRPAPKAPRPVKYRDDAGNVWTGYGHRPEWFKQALAAGKSAEDMKLI